jgi:hypothetical protein
VNGRTFPPAKPSASTEEEASMEKVDPEVEGQISVVSVRKEFQRTVIPHYKKEEEVLGMFEADVDYGLMANINKYFQLSIPPPVVEEPVVLTRRERCGQQCSKRRTRILLAVICLLLPLLLAGIAVVILSQLKPELFMLHS